MVIVQVNAFPLLSNGMKFPGVLDSLQEFSWQSRYCSVCTGVHARVYVYLLWWVWDALNRCLEHLPPGHALCTLRRLSTPVCIFVNTLSAGYAH